MTELEETLQRSSVLGLNAPGKVGLIRSSTHTEVLHEALELTVSVQLLLFPFPLSDLVDVDISRRSEHQDLILRIRIEREAYLISTTS